MRERGGEERCPPPGRRRVHLRNTDSWRMISKSRGHLHRDVLIRCWKVAVEWACEGGRERREGRKVLLSHVGGTSRTWCGRHGRTRGIPRTWFRRFDRQLEVKVQGWQPFSTNARSKKLWKSRAGRARGLVTHRHNAHLPKPARGGAPPNRTDGKCRVPTHSPFRARAGSRPPPGY